MIDATLLEMTEEENEVTSSPAWALDPRLPRIAAQAAVEFDWLIQLKRGQMLQHHSRESIKALGFLLAGSLGALHGGDARKGVSADSLGLNLLAKAYNASYTQPVKTREELADAIQQLTTSLQNAGEEREMLEIVLEGMRGFCVALSEYAAAYRKMIYGSRTEHPYRK